MDINVQEHIIRVSIVSLSGRVDAFSVMELREIQDHLLKNGRIYFVADLSQVTFMDSTGIATLVTLLKRAHHHGGAVVLVAPVEPAANRILTLTRFDKVFPIATTVEEAMDRFHLCV